MKKTYYLLTIIFFTFISVITMVVCDDYIINSKQKAVQFNQPNISSLEISNDNQVNVVKKDHKENFNTGNHLEEDYLSQGKSSGDYISNDKENGENSIHLGMKTDNKSKGIYNDIYLRRKVENPENYYYDNKENEQSVFKVSTGKIIENLTTSDKLKLLYVSMQLGREDYKKVEKHLYAEDAEDGVLKALKLLKEDLSEKEYEKVRRIAGRFIDMDAAERLY